MVAVAITVTVAIAVVTVAIAIHVAISSVRPGPVALAIGTRAATLARTWVGNRSAKHQDEVSAALLIPKPVVCPFWIGRKVDGVAIAILDGPHQVVERSHESIPCRGKGGVLLPHLTLVSRDLYYCRVRSRCSLSGARQ